MISAMRMFFFGPVLSMIGKRVGIGNSAGIGKRVGMGSAAIGQKNLQPQHPAHQGCPVSQETCPFALLQCLLRPLI